MVRKRCSYFLDAERCAAAAGAIGVGVVECEALAVEAAFVVEAHADDVEVAFFVDDDFDAFVFDDFIVGCDVGVEIEFVGHAGAAAGDDLHAQMGLWRGFGVFFDQF